MVDDPAFYRTAPDLGTPVYVDGFAVTPSDSTVFTQPTRALYIGGSGTLAVRMFPSGTLLTFITPAGTTLPIRCDKVLTTGTSATFLNGLF